MINKMDRLILELGLSPQEAYLRLRGIITHVNMIVSAFQSEQHISDADAVLAHEDAKATLDDRWALPTPYRTHASSRTCVVMHNEIVNSCQGEQRIAEAAALLAPEGLEAVLADRWI